MGRYAALLRGIAPSNPNMTNDKLRAVFEGLTHGRGTYLTVTFIKGRAASAPVPEQPDPRTRVVGYDEESGAFLAVIDNSEPGKTPDFMVWLERTYGKDITTRTWLTVRRIVRRLETLG